MTTECPRCGAEIKETASGSPAECANCGLRLTEDVTSRPVLIIRDYFQELWRIIFSPIAYFRKMPGGLRSGRVGRALGFALATHWLGSVIGYFWRALGRGLFHDSSRMFSGMFSPDNLDSIRLLGGNSAGTPETSAYLWNWFWGMGSVIADPFLTLAMIFFTAIFVYIGARILVPSDRTSVADITFESAVKIVAYGMSPAILTVIPVFGSILATLGIAIVTIIGAREVYQITTARAIVVGLFPKVLFFGTIVLGALVFVASLIKIVLSFF